MRRSYDCHPPPLHEKKKRKRRTSRHERAMMEERAAHESRIYNLVLDINNLKQEIAQLRIQEHVLQTRALLRGQSCVQVARAYFELFRQGYTPSALAAGTLCEFLVAYMDPHVTLGTTAYSIDMILTQWERYTGVFECYEVMLRSITMITPAEDADDGGAVLDCHSVFGGRVTRQLMEMVFPHAKDNLVLMTKLVGKTLRCPAITRMYFNRHGQIQRYDATADFFSGMQTLLADDPVGLAALMRHAKIEEGVMIGHATPSEKHAIAYILS